MAMTLAEAGQVTVDPRLPGVISQLSVSNVLNRTPFEPVVGRAFSYNSEATLPAAAFRAVNAGYTESTGTFATATENIVILGGEYVVDRFLERTSAGTVASLVLAQQDMKARSVAAKFGDTFFNGDTAVDANSFNGLKKRLSGGQVLSSGANGAAINTDAATRSAFYRRLDELLAACPDADALYASRQVLAQIRIAYRESMMTGLFTIDDLTGRQVEGPSWNGVPFLDAGVRADQTAILAQNETVGTATNTSSIYAVNFGDNLNTPGVVGLTNGGLQVDAPRELETKPAILGRIEFYCGLALLGINPAARLTGVIAA